MFDFDRFERLVEETGVKKSFIAKKLGKSTSVTQGWKEKKSRPSHEQLLIIAEILHTTPEYLTDQTDDPAPANERFVAPDVTDDIVSYPVLGDVAAGYDHICYEDWEGDTIDIPKSYLKGRKREDYFVLRVCGDSMYPTYQNGDHVLVLRQTTMNHSGEIGVVQYGDEFATLKRIEYVNGEDWMRLSPVNPQFPPVTIHDESLEHCRVLGIPKILIREIV